MVEWEYGENRGGIGGLVWEYTGWTKGLGEMEEVKRVVKDGGKGEGAAGIEGIWR